MAARILHDLLTGSASSRPDKTAIRCPGKEFTYREADAFSDKIAFCLKNAGVTAGDRVGVYSDKTAEAVMSLYGVLKAGGVYVPFEPAEPPVNQAFMIGDCGIGHLIVSRNKIDALKKTFALGPAPKSIIVIDGDLPPEDGPGDVEVISRRAVDSTAAGPLPAVNEDDIASILYTSGTTGRPKGVMLSHRAVHSAAADWCGRFGINSGDRLSLYSSLRYSMSQNDIFGAAFAGAALCIPPQGAFMFAGPVADFMEDEKISVWASVPSILIELALHGDLGERDLSSLGKIIFSGDVFPPEYLRELMRTLPHVEFYNVYGSTETCSVACYPVRTEPEGGGTMPAGKAWDDTALYLVGENGSVVPPGPGAEGELYVGGPKIMSGYWGDKEGTGEVLSEDPFPGVKGRVCRTRDIVKVDENGDLLILGRIDDVIKKYGHRIGLYEIEDVLNSHEDVSRAVVKGVPDREKGQVIKAAVVPKKGASLSEEDLRNFCAGRLSQIKVPDMIEFREDLPRTSTGKVDRKKL